MKDKEPDMYVCMCVYIYIYMYYTCMGWMDAKIHGCMAARIYACMHVSICIHTLVEYDMVFSCRLG